MGKQGEKGMLIITIVSNDFKAVHMSKLTRTKKGDIGNTYNKELF